MNRCFANLPDVEKQAAYAEVALRTNTLPVITEKDFWVCWLLGRIFATPGLGEQCVFKGGTSLSKVFGIIRRFSEDIDLGLSPASLGWKESDLDNAPTHTQRRKRMDRLMEECANFVSECFQAGLEEAVSAVLGPKAEGKKWLVYTDDLVAHSPVLRFHYPRAVPAGTSYIEQAVKIEFGSLTDQRPTGTHRIVPMVAALAPEAFDDFQAEVVALEVERTFWEKATILHAEFHRPADKAQPPRYARHYSDFAALWRHPLGQAAAARLDLLDRVRLHKSRYFASSWANYDSATIGSLRLVPPEARLNELRRDYEAMLPMFIGEPEEFDQMMSVLRDAEETLNRA
jgi:hypothetical protein